MRDIETPLHPYAASSGFEEVTLRVTGLGGGGGTGVRSSGGREWADE